MPDHTFSSARYGISLPGFLRRGRKSEFVPVAVPYPSQENLHLSTSFAHGGHRMIQHQQRLDLLKGHRLGGVPIHKAAARPKPGRNSFVRINPGSFQSPWKAPSTGIGWSMVLQDLGYQILLAKPAEPHSIRRAPAADDQSDAVSWPNCWVWAFRPPATCASESCTPCTRSAAPGSAETGLHCIGSMNAGCVRF